MEQAVGLIKGNCRSAHGTASVTPAWGLALETSSKNTYRVLVTRGHWRALRLEWREWRMNPVQRFAMINPETRSQNCSN